MYHHQHHLRKQTTTSEGWEGRQTEIAQAARGVEPLDTSVVADHNIFDELSDSDNDTGALVATDKRELGVQRPVTLPGVEIGVADCSR